MLDVFILLQSKFEDINHSDGEEEIAMQPLLHGKDSEKIFKVIEWVEPIRWMIWINYKSSYSYL